MQEEVNQKTINICITAGRITANVLKAALRKYLKEREKYKNRKVQKKDVAKNEKIRVKARDKAEKKLEAKKPKGKQTIKQLMDQGAQLTNIPITDDNIKSFDRIARKYGIDYSLKKDSSEDPPKYFIFFKAKDGKVMNSAFSEYTRNMINRNEKSSIREKLRSVGEQVKTKVQERTREKSKSREVEL